MSQFLINMSGTTIPVYNSTNSSKVQIGSLSNREAYSEIGSEGDFHSIKFLSTSGLKTGYLINPPSNSGMPCTNYPYKSDKVPNSGDNSTYKMFKFRRNESIYTVNGTYWGSVASGRLVACITSLAGDSHPEWKAINYVEGSNGLWTKVSGEKKDYGFVNTGLGTGSGPSSISMYGTW